MNLDPKVSIEFDERTSKLRVRCPIWSNELITAMESRSWSKAQRAWLVPVSRANVDYLNSKLIGPGLASITDEAKSKLKVEAPSSKSRGGLPSWYKFKTAPRKHQKRAYKLYGVKTTALFMIMRSGKTKVIIDLSCAYRMENEIDCLLIVCKLSVRRTWLEQFQIHAPIPANFFIPRSSTSKGFDRWLAQKPQFPVMVIGTESLSAGAMKGMAERFLTSHKRPFMVVDESSMIAGHQAARTENCIDLGHHAVYRSILNGTPIKIGPLDLFMQFEFLDTNILGIGDYYAFRNRYAVMGGYQREVRPGVKQPTQIVGYQNIDELVKTVAPYTFEVTEDELDLPEKVPEKRYVTLSKRQQALYDQLKNDGAYSWQGQDVVAKNVLELMLRLHQIVGGYTVTRKVGPRGREVSEPHEIVAPEDNPKIAELLDVIREANADRPRQGIVWCAYRPEIDAVVVALKKQGLRVGQIHGEIDEEDRELTRQKFQKGGLDWIVANASTGSMGLDMSAASINAFFSNTNRFIDRSQAEERPRVEGKKESVLQVDIIAEDTVDETFIESLAQKLDLSEYVKRNLKAAIAMIRK